MRDAEAADQFVEAQAAHFDPESFRQPFGRLGPVFQQWIHGLDRAEQPDLGDHTVDDVLPEAEILAHGPVLLDERPHRAQEPRHHVARPVVVRVEVDAALGPAEGHVPAVRVVIEAFLQGHPLC